MLWKEEVHSREVFGICNVATLNTPKTSYWICSSFSQAWHITFHLWFWTEVCTSGWSKPRSYFPPPHLHSLLNFCVSYCVLPSAFYPFFCPLLFQAIIESPNNQLTLSDIYAWFQSTFGHFRQHNATWKVTRNTKPNNNSLTKTRNLCLIITQ